MKTLLRRLASFISGGRSEEAAEPAEPVGSAALAFEPQSRLERELMAAAGDPARRADFERQLLEADLYVATPEAPQDEGEWRTLETEERVSILNVHGPDGNPIPALFTTEARIAEFFGPGTGYMAMRGEVLFAMFEQSGAILNPGFAYGVHWTPDMLAALLGKPVRRTIERDTKLLLGTPSDRPEDLIRRLRDALAQDPRVEEAWLALAIWPEADARSWYLDIRTRASADEVVPAINDALKDGEYGLPVDIMINAPGSGGTGIRLKPAQLN